MSLLDRTGKQMKKLIAKKPETTDIAEAIKISLSKTYPQHINVLIQFTNQKLQK
jgi:hypothetical protein